VKTRLVGGSVTSSVDVIKFSLKVKGWIGDDDGEAKPSYCFVFRPRRHKYLWTSSKQVQFCQQELPSLAKLLGMQMFTILFDSKIPR
jgi:hypothetical protein